MNVINEINGLRTMMPSPPNNASPGPHDEPDADVNKVPVDDTVDFSAEGAALAETEESSAGDGARMAHIARIRSEIQNGTYDVSGKLDSILDKLLDDL